MSVSTGNPKEGSGHQYRQQQGSNKSHMNGQPHDSRRSTRRRGPSGANNNNNNNNYKNNTNNNTSSGNGHNNRDTRSTRPRAAGGEKKMPFSSSNSNSAKNSSTNNSSPSPDDIDYNPVKKIIPKQKPDQLQNHTALEVELTGPIFANPSQLGFRPKAASSRPRPIPKYLLHQPRLLVTPEFSQDPWDASNQNKMLSMEQEAGGRDTQTLYEEMQKMRDVERKQMEVLGLVDVENVSKDLNDAIHFQGSCLDMCPVFERVRRALENNVKNLERDPTTGKISRERAIKAFSRPAAGQPPPLPSEVRPPHVLVNTLDYLIDNTLGLLPESHSFIWDRTRSIRQDFTYQNFFGPEAIDCNEKIVRIHLLCLHVMAGAASEGGVEYSQQQELEQFNKALQTLLEIYKDIRNHGGEAPNEAEFRAYYLLSHLRDPEQEREVQQLPNHIINDPFIQLALMFRNLICQSNIVERGYHNTVGSLLLFEEFFKIVRSAQIPFLISCLLETHFNEIRFYALKSMSRSYHTKSKPYPAEKLQRFLAFDNVEQVVKFVQYYEVDIIHDGQGKILVDLFNKDKLESVYKLNSIHDKPKLSPAYTRAFDGKFLMQQGNSANIRALIDSGRSNSDLRLKSASAVRKANPQSAAFKLPQSAALNLPPPATNSPVTFSSSSSTATTFPAATPAIGTKSLSDFLASNDKKPSLGGTFGFGSGTNSPFGAKPQNSLGKSTVSGLGATNKALANTFGEPSNSQFPGPSTPTFNSNPIAKVQFANNTTENTASSNGSALSGSQITGVNFGATIQLAPLFKFGEIKAEAPIEKKFPLATSTTTTTATTLNTVGSSPSFNFSKTSNTTNLPPTARDVPESKALPLIASSNPTSAPPPITSQPSQSLKLKDDKHFATACDLIYHDILSNVVGNELNRILPNLVEQLNSNIRRAKAIQTTRNEVYENILDEIVKYELLQVQADYFYQNSLRKKTAKLFIKKGKECREKALIKEKKRQELRLIKFTGSSRSSKRLISASSSPGSETSSRSLLAHKRVKLNSVSPSYITETQQSVEKLWEPIDLKSFIKQISSRIKIKLESKDIEFTFLILVENWESNYSKWLNNKLKMTANMELRCYEKILATDRLKFKFTSLPPGNYESKKYFSKSPFIILECGKTIDLASTMVEKLQTDREKLLKLVKLLNGYSFYKIQLVLLYWDCTGIAALSGDEVSTELGLDSLRQEECFQNIDLVDMTDNEDINEKLDNVFHGMSSRFKGELTTRGQKKISKLKRRMKEDNNIQRDSVPTSVEASHSVDYDLKEQDQLSRAKALRKYDYLSKHISNGNSFANTTNSSFVTAYNIFPTSDTSRSGTQNISQYFPNTFLNNSTLNDSTIMNSNVSILGGFGNGIVGESTPFSSPGKSKIKKPTLGNIPKGLLELKELAQGIKKKYNRN